MGFCGLLLLLLLEGIRLSKMKMSRSRAGGSIPRSRARGGMRKEAMADGCCIPSRVVERGRENKGARNRKRDRDESEKERGWRGADYAHTVTNP